MNHIVIPSQQQQYSLLPAETTDALLVEMWLEDASQSTRDAYLLDLRQFFEKFPITIQQINLRHLQIYKSNLFSDGKEVSTINRKLKSIKSLLSFAKKTGYIPLNPGVMIKLPKEKEELAERIIPEDLVLRMIHFEEQYAERKGASFYDRRNAVLLRLIYATGARVSEICQLRWKDIHPRKDTGQVTIFGKGSKTRHVLLKPVTYGILQAYRGEADDDDYVFPSRGGRQKGHRNAMLTTSQVARIIEASAIRANVFTYEKDGKIRSRVTPHCIRHSHGSHAIDNGCPFPLTSTTMGHADPKTTMRYIHVHPDTSSAQYLRV